MRKKKDSEQAFKDYWKSYINEVIRRKIEYVIDQHQPEILKFRKKWKIPPAGFKNRRSYNRWYKNQLRQFKKQPQIVYGHNVEILLETQKTADKNPGKDCS